MLLKRLLNMIYSKISEILKLSNAILCSKVKLLHIYFYIARNSSINSFLTNKKLKYMTHNNF